MNKRTYIIAALGEPPVVSEIKPRPIGEPPVVSEIKPRPIGGKAAARYRNRIERGKLKAANGLRR